MPPSMPPAPKPRPYRRFLTSALHTRFVHAAGLALIWHITVAGFASDWYSSIPSMFWAFFPLGTAGIKALLFSLSSMLIFMLQIATFRIGRRCTPSNWTSIKTVLLSYSTYATVCWYLASAWWFCEVFVFTSPASKELGWIINGGYGAPDKLNERPIYLRLFFLLLGAAQALIHICKDYSSLPLRIEPPKKPGNQQQPKQEEPPAVSGLLGKCIPAARQAATVSGMCSAVGPFIYTALFRRPLWSWHVWWAKAFANISRSDAAPPEGFYIGSIMLTAFFFGTLLLLTWQFNILLFEAYMLQEPTKNSQPLSASSKDPNGTLLHGLKAKRELVQTFAFWELNIIAQKHPDRRKDIFSDFERPNQGPIFISMLDAALDVLKRIEHRMKVLDPPPPASASATPTQDDVDIQRLPRILPNAVPAKNPITQPGNPADRPKTLDRISSFVSQEARRVGSSSNPWSPPIDETKQRAIEYTKPTLKGLQSRAEAAQQSPLGRFLLTTPTRLIKAAVLGTPTGNSALTVHAARSITTMLVASLTEDTYGKAVRGVPPMVLTLTKTIFATEAFVHKHTNSGAVSPNAARELKDVLIVYQTLKSCLRELLSAFKLFLSDVGLSIRDLNDSQRAAGDGELFEVVEPTTVDAAISEGLDDRQTIQNGGAGNRREMQEVNDQHRQRDRQREQQEQQMRRRRSSEAENDKNRPGRLFKQLDDGSAYQANLRERKKSIGRGGAIEANPLAAGSMRDKGKQRAQNPFGARDFGPEPAGGLRTRRLGEVR